MMKRRMRTIPTHKPKSFASSRIKRDYYPPAIRVFTGAETPAESGDAYIQKKINQFSNIQLKPADQLNLIALLRPAYEVKKVIEQSDFAEALTKLQEMKSIEKVPLVLKDQLQAIQEYVKQMTPQKKKEVLIKIVNNDNPFPEFQDIKLDDVKKAVAPLYSKDDIMALYGNTKNVKLFENPRNNEDDDWFKNQVDLENQVEELKDMMKQPQALQPERVRQPLPEMEDEMEDIINQPEMLKADPVMTFFKNIDEDQLNKMNLSQLKKLVAENQLGIRNLGKYKNLGEYPNNKYGLVQEILDKRDEYFTYGRMMKSSERRGRPRKVVPPQRQEGEGFGDVMNSVFNTLLPKSAKSKIFDVLIGNRLKHAFNPRTYK